MAHAGMQFGSYTLEARVGSGGFGDVWRARSPRGPVAVKLLQAQEQWARQRFETEARALERLDDPHCLSLLDFGVLPGGQPYIVTPFLEGTTLAQWLPGSTEQDRLEVARQVAQAIEAAHRIGVVHRDLKPSNVFVSVRGEAPYVTVIDFGLARLVNSRPSDVTKTGEVIGTAGYMSPEQLRGERTVGMPTDVYSLGVLFFEMLAGHRPFDGASPIVIAMAHLREPAPALQVGPPPLRALVARMLAKDPAERPTMAEVVAALSPGPAQAPSRKRAGWIVAALVAAALAVAAFTMSTVLFNPPPNPNRETSGPAFQAARRDLGPLTRATPTPPSPSASVQPASAPDGGAQERAGGSAGCGRQWRPGVHVLRGTTLDLPVRVPLGYDPNRPAPVLLALHDIGQYPEHLLELADLNRLVDRDGVVIVAPAGTERRDVPLLGSLPAPSTWLDPRDHERIIADLGLAADELCLDLDRIYIWGHGNGGAAGEFVACQLDGVVALAMTAHRWWGTRDLCRTRPPVPSIFISPTGDRAAPVDGLEDCFGNSSKWSLEKHERALRERHECRGERRWDSVEHGRCSTASCSVDLVWCQVDGGRDWRTMPQRSAAQRAVCESTPGTFEFAEHIWRFFVGTGPR